MEKFINFKENKMYSIICFENSKEKIFMANGKVLSKKKLKEILNESFKISTSYSFKLDIDFKVSTRFKSYLSAEKFKNLCEDLYNKTFIFEFLDNNNKKKYVKASTLIFKERTFYSQDENYGYFAIMLIINDEVISPMNYCQINNLKMEGNFFVIEKKEKEKTPSSKNFLELKKENEFIFKK